MDVWKKADKCILISYRSDINLTITSLVYADKCLLILYQADINLTITYMYIVRTYDRMLISLYFILYQADID